MYVNVSLAPLKEILSRHTILLSVRNSTASVVTKDKVPPRMGDFRSVTNLRRKGLEEKFDH